jgi:hypothetical protein
MCLCNINKVTLTGSPDVLTTTTYAELSTNSKTRWLEENNWALYIMYYIIYKLLPPAYDDIVIDFGVCILVYFGRCYVDQCSRYSDSLRAGGQGIESRRWRGFLHPFRLALGPTYPPVKWVPRLSLGGKATGDVALTTNSHPAPRSKKEQSYTSTPPMELLLSVLGWALPLPWTA